MALVRFTFDDDHDDAIDLPPDDALARSSWLHLALCRMLHSVMTDESLSESERRDAAGVLATKITQATPNHEIYQAKQMILDDQRKTEKQAALEGTTVPSAKKRQSKSIRADAPRGRTPETS